MRTNHFSGQEFKTSNFSITAWKQDAIIRTHGERTGSIEVYYLQEKPLSGEGPFTIEERKLIEAIAERLGRIIERLHAEDAARECEKVAATGRLAARVAHEINNPLAGIKGSFQLIKDLVSRDHPRYKYVKIIDKEIDRIARIVHQMFDIYRPKQQALRNSPANKCIHEVVALLKTTCRDHDINIQFEANDDANTVELPEAMFKQILYNLIRNAIDASPHGQTVRVTAAINDKTLTVEVSDRGSGIPEDIRHRIFEPFVSSKVDKENSGLGLGLSVCKNTVEQMGGTLDFETTTGYGTTFRVHIAVDQKNKEKQNAGLGTNIIG